MAKTTNYVLVRVKLREEVAAAFKDMAQRETERTGRYVYVSNLVREALRDYLLQREAEPGISS